MELIFYPLNMSFFGTTKSLKLKPFKTATVHELQLHDLANRVNFCNWFLQSVNNAEIAPTLFSVFC
jgi:hypothetical protein